MSVHRGLWKVHLSVYSVLLVFACLCRTTHAEQPKDESAVVVQQILSEGIALSDQFRAEVGKPTLLDQPIEKRLELVKELAPRVPWSRFSQDSVFAPVVIKTEAVDGPNGKRVAYRVRSAFLVHASLEELEDKELMEAALMNSQQGNKSTEQAGKEVTSEELAAAGIENSDEDVSYGKVTLPLLNRVRLSGVIQAANFRGEGFLGVAWKMDPRFRATKLASKWQLMKKNKLGEPELGPENSYQGCGGFIAVFEIEPNLLLVESKFVMHEPYGWFNGSQFLRSKLPPALQENARSFRRSIGEAKK